MRTSCAGRVALVVGASKGGTGTATAVRLAAEGARVAITARDAEGLKRTLAEIEALGGTGIALTCDLAKEDGGRDTLVARAEEALGPVDQLVYVAADLKYAPFEDLPLGRLQRAVEVNLKAPWLIMQQVIQRLRQRSASGAIVLIGTRAAHPLGGPPFPDVPQAADGALYGATKAALHRLAGSVAAGTYADHISVNVLSPLAAIGTPALRASGYLPDEIFEPVETMAEATLALLTADPRTMTGQDVISIELLMALDRSVHDRTGRELVAGWQPEQLPAFHAARTRPDRPSARPSSSGAEHRRSD